MLPVAGDTYVPGMLLAGKYRVERVLGRGTMGTVVAAVHEQLGERRALKLLHSGWLHDREKVDRFLREARAAVRLKSAHVARIHDVGQLESGVPFIVLEYLDGCDLSAYAAARGTLTIAEAARFVMQACDALDEAHRHGIVHRDLKPANLFVETQKRGEPIVKVLDFGVAKIARADRDVGGTHVDAFLGTPLYMSPEQVRSTREVDQRTDIFALGAILYKLLTGRAPFVGGSVPELCAAILTTTPPPIRKFRPDVPPELEATIAKCLEKNPADRFASASELATALARFDGYRGAPMPLVRTVPLSMPQKAAPAVSEAASVASVDIAHDDSLVPTSGAEARSSLGPGPKALLAAGAILGLLAGTLHSLQRASEAREEALRGGGVDAAGAEGNAGGAATEPSALAERSSSSPAGSGSADQGAPAASGIASGSPGTVDGSASASATPSSGPAAGPGSSPGLPGDGVSVAKVASTRPPGAVGPIAPSAGSGGAGSRPATGPTSAGARPSVSSDPWGDERK